MVAAITKPGIATRPTREEVEMFSEMVPSMKYVPNPVFYRVGAEKRFFGVDARYIPIPEWDPVVDDDVEYAGLHKKSAVLSKDNEAELFLRYNYAKYRMRQALPKNGRVSIQRVRMVSLWYQRLIDIKNQIAKANMALVVAMAKRRRVDFLTFNEQVSENSMALLRCIEGFDASRGFKFSTYLCRAILSNLNRLFSKRSSYRLLLEDVGIEPETLPDRTEPVKSEDTRVADLYSALLKLPPRERMIVIELFGLISRAPLDTEVVAKREGVSTEMIRKLKIRAFKGIHTWMRIFSRRKLATR